MAQPKIPLIKITLPQTSHFSDSFRSTVGIVINIKKQLQVKPLENQVKDSEFFNVRFQSKPFMIWIWISAVLLAIGGIFSLTQRFNEK